MEHGSLKSDRMGSGKGVKNIGLYNSRAYLAEQSRLILLFHAVFRPYTSLRRNLSSLA